MDQPTRRLDADEHPSADPYKRLPPQCTDCGGVLVEARLVPNGAIGLIPLTGIFFLPQSNIRPFVCQNCGLIKLYATHPGALAE